MHARRFVGISILPVVLLSCSPKPDDNDAGSQPAVDAGGTDTDAGSTTTPDAATSTDAGATTDGATTSTDAATTDGATTSTDAAATEDSGPTDPFGLSLAGVQVNLPPFSVLVDGPASTVVGGELAFSVRLGAGDTTGATFSWTLPAGTHLASGSTATSANISVLFDSPDDHLLEVRVTRGSDEATGGTLVHVSTAGVAPALGTLTGGTSPVRSDVDLLDAYLNGQAGLTEEQGLEADLDLDGRISRQDQVLLQQAVDATAAAPVYLSRTQGSALSTVLVIHPELLDPAANVTVRLTPTVAGSWDATCQAGQQGQPRVDEVPLQRALPGYLVFAVPIKYACLTATETVTVELDVGGTIHTVAAGFRVVPLPAVSAYPGAPVIEAMGRLRLAMENLPAAAAAYADQIGASADEKAVLQGTATRSAELFAESYAQFFVAFKQLDLPTRSAWEQLARARGLDALIDELRDLTPGVSFDPTFALISPDTGEALVGVICDFNRIAETASGVAEINSSISSALEWLDWFPLNRAPTVGPVITFLATVSNTITAVTDLVKTAARYVPTFGDALQIRPSPKALQLAETSSLEAYLEINIATGLCNLAQGAAVDSLIDLLKKTLKKTLASNVPLANEAFRAAKYNRQAMDSVVGTVYDAIGRLAGKIVDATGLQGYLSSLGGKLCSLLQDPSVPVHLDNPTAACGSVSAGVWTCTEACSAYPDPRSVALTGTRSICNVLKLARGTVTCAGEPPPIRGAVAVCTPGERVPTMAVDVVCDTGARVPRITDASGEFTLQVSDVNSACTLLWLEAVVNGATKSSAPIAFSASAPPLDLGTLLLTGAQTTIIGVVEASDNTPAAGATLSWSSQQTTAGGDGSFAFPHGWADCPVRVRADLSGHQGASNSFSPVWNGITDVGTIVIETCPTAIGFETQQMQVDSTQTLTVVCPRPEELYSWEILSGGGTLSVTAGNSTVFTAPAVPAEVVVQLTAGSSTCCSVTFDVDTSYWEPWDGPLVTSLHPWGLRGFYDPSGTVELSTELPYVQNGKLVISATQADGDHDLTYAASADPNRPTGMIFKYKGLHTIIRESSLSGTNYYQDDSILFWIDDADGNYVAFYPYAHSTDNPYGGNIFFDNNTGEEIVHDLRDYGFTGPVTSLTIELNKQYLSGGEFTFELDYVHFE